MATISVAAAPNSRRSARSQNSAKLEEETPEKRRHNYAALCRLLCDGAVMSMRHVFNQIHPSISLVEHLSQPQIHKNLRRLKVQGIISEDEWHQLYSPNKRVVSSNKYSPTLLFILLRHICSLSEPYPGGWEGIPDKHDHSLSGELARVHVYLRTFSSATQREVPRQEFEAHWATMENVFANLMGGGGGLGSSNKKIKPKPLNLPNFSKTTRMNDAAVDEHINRLQEWRAEADRLIIKYQRIHNIHAKRGELHELSSLSAEFVGGGSGQGGERSKTAPPARSKSILSQSGKKGIAPEDQPRIEVTKALEKDIIAKYYKRLTEDIRAEDVVGRLVQQAVLTQEDKSNVELQMSNLKCMKMVLDLIIKKGGKSFDIFCDVIKFRYKGLYNILIEAKKAPFLVTRPDEGTELANALRIQLNEVLSSLCPVPWCTNIQLPISDFYQPLYITDLKGRKVSPLDIFKQHSKCANPKRILIEGEAGVGKTTMLKYITEQWAKKLNPNLADKFKILVYVDLRTAKSGSLLETIAEQCLPSHYRRTSDELYNIFKTYQKRTIFILDGYEHINSLEDEFLDLLHKAMFRDSFVVMATRSNHVTRALLKQFDTRLLVAGVQPKAREDLISRYAKITDTTLESLTPLIEKLQSSGQNLVQLFSTNPTLCMCLCLMAKHEQSLDFPNLTVMLERTITALQQQFCVAHKVKLKGNRNAQEWLRTTMCTFEEIAFENLLTNRIAFDLDLELNKYSNTDLQQYGLLDTITHSGTTYTYFTSAIFHEFLAAKFLTRIEEQDFPRYIDSLTGDKHVEGTLLFFCGLRAGDYDNEQTTKLFNAICTGNTEDGVATNEKIEEETESITSAASRATVGRDVSANREAEIVIESRLADYNVSLKCLAQCEGREDLAKIVANSMTGKLYTKSKDFVVPDVFIGFGYVLQFNSPKIVDLDLRLDHLGYYYSYALTCLASSIETSGNIHTLRLRWTSDNLLALFLANVFGRNLSIATLKIYDESNLERDNITAMVWSDFWSARKGMQNVELFSFTDCKNAALVSSVIHNTPNNLVELSLRGCTLDMVGMHELSSKMENERLLRIIHLEGVNFRKADFGHLTRGIKLTRSVLTISLANMDLDSSCIIAIGEALKFNRSLRDLDLRGVTFDRDACKALGLSMALNKTIHEVDLTGAHIPPQGAEDMHRMKRENVILQGVQPPRAKSDSSEMGDD